MLPAAGPEAAAPEVTPAPAPEAARCPADEAGAACHSAQCPGGSFWTPVNIVAGPGTHKKVKYLWMARESGVAGR